MSLFEENRNTNLFGNGGNKDSQSRSLTQMLESNIDKINEGYTPQEKPWQQMVKGGAKPPPGRPLMTILSERLNEIDQGHKPSYDPHEAVKGLGTNGLLSDEPFPKLAQNQAGGSAEGWGGISDHDFAQQAPTNTYGARVGNSLHTGHTRGANQTFHNVQNDPHAKDMLNRTIMHGQHPEEFRKFVADSSKWPHVQAGTTVAGGLMTGAADAATPTVEVTGKLLNMLPGETGIGNRAADFGSSVADLDKEIKKATNAYHSLNQDGQLTPIGDAASWASKAARVIPEATLTYAFPVIGAGNHVYRSSQAIEHAYDETQAALDAQDAMSGQYRHPAENESLAYREALLTGVSHAFSPLLLSKAKAMTAANTDTVPTKIAQNAITGEGRPLSQKIIREILERVIQSSEWDEEHF